MADALHCTMPMTQLAAVASTVHRTPVQFRQSDSERSSAIPVPSSAPSPKASFRRLTDHLLSCAAVPRASANSGTVVAATNDQSAGVICNRRDAARVLFGGAEAEPRLLQRKVRPHLRMTAACKYAAILRDHEGRRVRTPETAIHTTEGLPHTWDSRGHASALDARGRSFA